jgi:hypothetical protein
MKLKLAFEGAKSIADLGNNTFVVTMDGGESVEFSLVCASVLKTETESDMSKAPPKALTANAKKAQEMAAAAESSCKAFPGTQRDPVDLITPKSAAITNSSFNSTHSSSTNIDELDDLDESDESDGLDSPRPLANRFGPRLNKETVNDVTGQGFSQEVGALSMAALRLDAYDESPDPDPEGLWEYYNSP